MDAQQIKAAVTEALRDTKSHDFADRSICLRQLVFAYHSMVASEEMLHIAIRRSTGELQAYFAKHVDEEAGHAEWLSEDLKAAEFDPGRPSMLSAAMVGSVYYLIRHVDACALLGYMVAMECFPVLLSDVEKLEAIHGVSMFRTLRFHAEHDVDHGDDVLGQIDKLTESQRELVMETALQTARYLAHASHTF